MKDDSTMKDMWSCSAGYRRAYQDERQIEAVIRLLRLDGATGLVDIGCGNGVFAIEAARRHPDCQVWCCDPLQSAIAECRRRAADAQTKNLRAFVASAESVPLPDGCADRILMRNVLHHVADPDAAFGEIGRLSADGARLVFEGPCNAWGENIGKLLTAIHMLMDDSHERTYLRSDTILAAIERHGLRTESVDSWSYPFKVGIEQIGMIEEHSAQEILQLRKREDGAWFVELTMTRIIATKGAQP